MLELSRNRHEPHQHIVTEPLDGLLIEIKSHPQDWFLHVLQRTCHRDAITSRVYLSPESEADEVLTVNVDVVLQKGVGDANKKVLGRLNYLELEALLTLLWDR